MSRSGAPAGVWAGRRRVGLVAAVSLVVLVGCSSGDGDLAAPEVAGVTTIAEGVTEPGDAAGAEQGSSTEMTIDGAVELAGSSWALTVVDVGKGRKDASVSTVPAVVNFGDGTIDAYDGVNTFSGSFEVDGSEVSITVGDNSGIAYPEPAKAQYQLFSVMPKTVSARRDDERLILELADGGQLVFGPAAGGISQT